MCQVPRCRGKTDSDGVVFYNKDVCGNCYDKHCQGKINLKRIFKIKEEASNPPQEEVPSKQTILAYNGR